MWRMSELVLKIITELVGMEGTIQTRRRSNIHIDVKQEKNRHFFFYFYYPSPAVNAFHGACTDVVGNHTID